MELLELAGYKSSYIHMSDLVDHFFPPVRAGLGVDEAYTDLRYWSLPLPELSDESEEDDAEDDGDEDEDDGEEGDEGDEEEFDDVECFRWYCVNGRIRMIQITWIWKWKWIPRLSCLGRMLELLFQEESVNNCIASICICHEHQTLCRASYIIVYKDYTCLDSWVCFNTACSSLPVTTYRVKKSEVQSRDLRY